MGLPPGSHELEAVRVRERLARRRDERVRHGLLAASTRAGRPPTARAPTRDRARTLLPSRNWCAGYERPPRAAAAVRDRDALEPESERVARGRAGVPALGRGDRRPARRGAAQVDRVRSPPVRRPRRATSLGVRPSRAPRGCGSVRVRRSLRDRDELRRSTSPRDLGVDHRRHPRHRRDAGLDPGVLAVRSLARAADADPARDVARPRRSARASS